MSMIIFLFGLCAGSFLNTVIYRLETREPIFFTPHLSRIGAKRQLNKKSLKGAGLSRSHCPKCGADLKWFDLMPVLSFVLGKGKCRYCGQKISWQYPAVETATALLFLTTFNFQLSTFNFFYYLIIICFLIIIFVYDLKHYLIPDKIIYPAVIVSGIWYLIFSIFTQDTIRQMADKIQDALLAILAGAGFFLFLVLVSRGRWMGLGDVKLAVLMGLVLGWPDILFGLFLAFLGGAAVGLGLIAFRKKTMKSQIPFGPFLASATILAMLFGDKLTKMLNWFML